ncbi:hypothetical protein [Bradyrhizobium sp. UFLA01-814]|uniref:hypothetical protein n=1 Tax=Bradyrhizobium sp. UFLA01-814 TaxID=3023480 RepID=UPI00398ABD7E
MLADGVAPDKIYPMNINRIFVSMDRIKPPIRKWWTTGSEIQQIMHDKIADVVHTYDGRANLSIDQGTPIEISRNHGKLNWTCCWSIPKGSSNVKTRKSSSNSLREPVLRLPCRSGSSSSAASLIAPSIKIAFAGQNWPLHPTKDEVDGHRDQE